MLERAPWFFVVGAELRRVSWRIIDEMDALRGQRG